MCERESSQGSSTDEEYSPEQQAASVNCGLPVVTLNSIGMKLVLIPAGEFLMGSPDHEEDRDSDEGPQHIVRITRPFFLGAYAVTQGNYETVVGENPSKFHGHCDYPVEQVSWWDAAHFCDRLFQTDGRNYRLPTEAEWEYACRAGTSTPFAFGDHLSSETDANYCGTCHYGGVLGGPYLKAPTSVGAYRANAWGLHDMHGNIREWCSDRYDEDYYASSPKEDPSGPPYGECRVQRGGGWASFPGLCRSASRSRLESTKKNEWLGFRVAMTLPVAASCGRRQLPLPFRDI